MLIDNFKKIIRGIWRLENTQIAYHQEIISRLRKESKIDLNQYEFKVYSQNGEDGIIEEIFNRIGVSNKNFLEIGAGDGLQNNTTYLLCKGWTGVWVEASKKNNKKLKNKFKKILNDKIKIYDDFITPENFEYLLTEKYKIDINLDLLSIDIDGNDYYIWESLNSIKPRVIVIEYNSTFPNGIKIIQNKDKKFWDGSFMYGANLKALLELGNNKGYDLVATDICGVNAFFVRKDLTINKFKNINNLELIYNPPRFYLKTFAGHKADFDILNN